MRPLPGDETTSRSRRTSFTDNDPTPLARPGHPPQMSYFLTTEEEIGDTNPMSVASRTKRQDAPKEGTFGVESLETTISSLPSDNENGDEKLRIARRNWKKKLAVSTAGKDLDPPDPGSPSSDDVSRNASPCHHRSASQTTLSRPFTPLSYASAGPTSFINSPYSRRSSDAGSSSMDDASQAIMSSGDEEKEEALQLLDSGSAPQLVMPSIKMPSRRPFTDKGKYMGRLKVLIAGDSGVGKSSLIKAIVQICEDIVHVDPLASSAISLPQSRKNSRTKSRTRGTDMEATSEITEVYASTRAYPAWWSDLEESRILRRRKSMGDSVLERNLCFVDTPGYSNKASCLETIIPVVDYIEAQLQKAASLPNMSDSDMVSMLSGNGGTQVDLVFYVFNNQVKSVDVEYLKRLSQFTNIIPIISQVDVLNIDQLAELKGNITSALETNNIRTFSLVKPGDIGQTNFTAPYAVSAHPSKDEETMDASLLMSPDYVQPLLPSELDQLVSQVFERDTISWLRHSAAKKFTQWRSAAEPHSKPQSLYRPLTQSNSLVSASNLLTAPVGVTTSYALARISDHTQREERIAQVRLANWAADLQRSLQNERNRFEELARADRAVWLTERLGECVQDGTIVPLSEARRPSFQMSAFANEVRAKQGTYSRRGRGNRHVNGVDPHDPLGLLQLNEEMKQKAMFALRLVGSFGFIGGLAFWITRQWHGAGGDVDSDRGLMSWMGKSGVW